MHMAESVVQPCKWELCTTKCSSDQALYEHLLKDHSAPWRKPGVEKLACGWADCKTEPHRRWLTQHLISHTEYRPFVCGVSTSCSKGFKTRVTLIQHIKYQHHLSSIRGQLYFSHATQETQGTAAAGVFRCREWQG
ncbi:hypothetical protein EXIGLDRAFT_408613 [Exidia glandulosa HHB12029]|uniref:C2H2-type domain-containing protein n=1 Tax=Exidia glandulosa HHB12029 TaxID=1314781 RepID=A0A165KRC3_EXIGL|nr:hypothetical protein EXIGLDRAFT_408613 [Exidia glandulosa HHB12029]